MSATVICLSTPADVLSVVPHLLGFHVDRSLVLVCLTTTGRRTRLGMVARVDLPGPGQASEVADALPPAVAREDPEAVILVAYGTADDDGRVAAEVVAAALTEVGVRVRDRVLVTDQRWRSLDWPGEQAWADVPGPDAPAALEFAFTTGSAPATSRTLLARRCAAGSRAALVGRQCDRLAGTDGEAGGEAGGEVTIERGAAVWGRLLTGPADPSAYSDATLALAALSLHAGGKPALRDALAGLLAPGEVSIESLSPDAMTALREHLTPPTPPSPATTAHLLDRLIQVAACVPDEYAVPVLTVLANTAWHQGNGAVARVALDRARAADPDYVLAALLDQMVTLGIRPLAM